VIAAVTVGMPVGLSQRRHIRIEAADVAEQRFALRLCWLHDERGQQQWN
jgi:hypothetical protein